MTESCAVAFITTDLFLKHRPPSGHPERPERLLAVVERLRRTGLLDRLSVFEPVPATTEQVLAVHDRTHLECVRNTCARGGGVLDEGDTFAVRESFDVAMLAAGAACQAVDLVLVKEASAAFCAVRPPGHHAERTRPMGFCLLNNAAVAARHAQLKHSVRNVAILDWDVHHGNGTQHIFEEDPTVLYVSLHQYPFYPGTGARTERGRGAGDGATLNIPLPAGTGEDQYLEAFETEVLPALRNHAPALLIISAGFDAHIDDPLGGMCLDSSSFARMTEMVRDVAPIVSVLEGGYDLEALAESIEFHLSALVNEI